MKLKKEEELERTSVVANNRMNRGRRLEGVNSYKQDIGFDILSYLKSQIKIKQEVRWIDVCCGEGKALIEGRIELSKEQINSEIKLEGLDLVDMQDQRIHDYDIELIIGSIRTWKPKYKYDLITCVHGLHYVGDKLRAINKLMNNLEEDGIFIANLSLKNLKDKEGNSLARELKNTLKEAEIKYNSRKNLLICEGRKVVEFNYEYIGSNEKAGPNYTGQEVVDSIYNRK